MIEATQHTPDELALDREQVEIAASAAYPEKQVEAATPLEWQMGQGYGNQLNNEYTINQVTVEPMAEIVVPGNSVEGDTPLRFNAPAYISGPSTVDAMPQLESNERPDENMFVINADRLASMNEAERKEYLRGKVAAIYEAKEQMQREWEGYKQQHVSDPELIANLEEGGDIQEVIDKEKTELLANAKPQEAWGSQAKKSFSLSSIGDAIFKVGVELAPQLAVSAALIAGSVGAATEAHANPWRDIATAGVDISAGRASTEVGIQNEGNKQYGRVGARHQDKREVTEDRFEDLKERTIEQFNKKRDSFNEQYVRDKKALYDRNPTQAQVDMFEQVASENFAALIKQRQDALDALSRKLELAEKHDVRAERREIRGVNRSVGEQRGDADTTATQQGIGVLDQVLRGQIQRH